jgi:hypothetical protein
VLLGMLMLLAAVGAASAGSGSKDRDAWPDSESPGKTRAGGDAVTRKGVEDAKRRELERKTPEARRDRERSHTAYSGDEAGALDLARAKFETVFPEPLWRGPRLEKGQRVRRYLSENTFTVTTGDGRELFVHSMEPVTYEDGGREVAIDTELTSDGSSLQAARTPAQARIAKSADGGVALPKSNLGFRLVGAEGSAEVDGDKAFFADALGGKDLDLSVAALPRGAAVMLQLRSEDAPESATLDFDLPAGASLRLTRGGGRDGGPRGDGASAEVVRNGEVIATISAPAAWDADGEPVPVSYELEGDQLTIETPHRGGDWRYPLLVDPYIQENFLWHSSGSDRHRWGIGWSQDGFNFHENCIYDWWCDAGNGLSGRGAYVEATPRGYNWGARGEWYWQAPADTNIVRVDWNYSHRAGNSCAWMRIVGSSDNVQGSSHCEGGNPTGAWFTSCTAHPSCDPGGSSENNWAIFGLWMSNGTFWSAWAHLRDVHIALWEGHRPTWGGVSGEASGWIDPGNGGHTFSAAASDRGLGIKQVSFRRPSKTSGTVTNYAPPSNCDGSRWAPCPLNPPAYTWGYDYSDLPEGVNTLGLLAEDIVGNPSSGDAGNGTWDARSWQVKVDATAPSYNAHSGSLAKTSAQGWITDTSPSLTTSITDPSPNGREVSGVRYSKIEYDPGTGPSQTKDNNKAGGAAPPCDSQTGCQSTVSHTFGWSGASDGTHSVRVSTDDATGQHGRSQTWNVKLDRAKPTIGTPTGSLYAPGSWITGGTKTVDVNTTDATSGVKKVELTVQRSGGTESLVQTKTPSTCCPNSFATALQWTPSTSDPEGTYDIRVKAYDDAGNAPEVRQWQIKLDRSPPSVSITGSLKDSEGKVTPPNAGLTVSATDPFSGVKTVEIKVDGVVKKTQTNPSPCDGCSMAVTWNYRAADYAPGRHTITVTAVDHVGNAIPPRSWDVYTEAVKPEIGIDGSLWAADDQTIAEASYNLNIDAFDGDATTDPETGVKTVEVKVDGTVKHSVTQPCDAGSCSVETTWTMNTASYSEGTHTIDVRVTDQAGNADSRELAVNVRRVPSLPAEALSLESAAARRVDGANELLGRAGTSVANVGDLTGDGLEEYAIGAPDANFLGGRVVVVKGGTSTGTVNMGDPSVQLMNIKGFAGEAAGSAVASAGDVNGDGVPDILVGSAGVTPGKVYVIFGGATGTVDLANLGSQGFVVNGPALTALPGASQRTFGNTLGAPNAGAFGAHADVNGDGRDDIVIGSSGEGRNAREGSGSAYVVFGKDDSQPVDAENLGSGGFRIDGPAAAAQAGYAVSIVGDVDADELADVVVTTPGQHASGRLDAGSAYVVLGRSSTTAVDLANLGAGGFPVWGASGDALGSSVASAGDANEDGQVDAVIGGRGATLVFGQDDLAPVDLTAPDDTHRIRPPSGVGYDASVVSSAGDLNGDARPDVLVGFPQARQGAGEAYALLTQDGVDSYTPYELGVLPGQRGSTAFGSATGDAAGTSLTAIDAGGDAEPAFLVGAPGADSAGVTDNGSTYVVPAARLSGAKSGTSKTYPPALTGEQRLSPQPGMKNDCYIREKPAYRYDYPPADFPRKCRKTVRGNTEQTLRTPDGGFLGEGRRYLKATYSSAKKYPSSGNLRLEFRKPKLRLKGTVAMNDGNTAAPLWDSRAAAPIGYLRHWKPSDPNQCSNPCLTLYDKAKNAISTNAANQSMRLVFESTPCMTSNHGKRGPRDYVLFSVKGDGNSPIWGLRALLHRDNLPNGQNGFDFDKKQRFRNYEILAAAWVSCAKPKKGRFLSSATTYDTQGWTAQHTFQSDRAYTECRKKGVDPYSPGCGVDGTTGAAFMWNYEYPRRADLPFTRLVTASHTTTGVGGGGIVRAVFEAPTGGIGTATDSPYVRRDRIDYVEHAVPCSYRGVAQWERASYRGVWGWYPRHVEDGYVRDHTTTVNCKAPPSP